MTPTINPTFHPTIPSLSPTMKPTIENAIIPTQTQLTQYTTLAMRETKSSKTLSPTIITFVVLVVVVIVILGLFLLQKKKVQRLKHANNDLKRELLSSHISGKPVSEEQQYDGIGNATDMVTSKDDNVTKGYVELIGPEPGALANDNYSGEQAEGYDGDGDVVHMVNTIKSNVT
eukprot:UN07362